jgi:PPM family protein phosphatase
MSFLKTIDAYALTDAGLKRARNEDSSRMLIPPSGTDQERVGALFVVADGMGGLGGGDIASRTAIDEIARAYYENGNPNLQERLYTALQTASVKVAEQAPRLGLPRIGSTAAGIVLTPQGDMLIFNVGDCRVYRVRGKEIERVSLDQSLIENRIQAGLTPEQAAKEVNSSLVTGFLGQPVPLKPELKVQQAVAGDVYILCSDGLWSLLQPKEIKNIAARSSARQAVKRLVGMGLKRGAPDNITAMVVRLGKAPNPIMALPVPVLAGAAIATLVVIGVLMLMMSGTFNPAVPTPTIVLPPTITPAPSLKVFPTDTPPPPTKSVAKDGSDSATDVSTP